MMQTDDKLVRMAGQMASYFRSYPDDDAIQGIAEHIVKFWTPNMRRALEARIAHGTDGIDRLVVAAMASPTQHGRPDQPTGESPIVKTTKGPAQLGQMASDAG